MPKEVVVVSQDHRTKAKLQTQTTDPISNPATLQVNLKKEGKKLELTRIDLSDQRAISKKTAKTRLLKLRTALNTLICKHFVKTKTPCAKKAARSSTRSLLTKRTNRERDHSSQRTQLRKKKLLIDKWKTTG